MAIGDISVRVVPDASGFWREFREKTSGQAEAEGRREGAEFRRGMQAAVRDVKVKVDADTSQAQAKLETLKKEGDKSSAGLLKSILPLAPALVPLAGAATAAGAAFGAMGAVALLAFKGAQAEIKAGTTDGQAFAAGVGEMKAALGGLEATASHGVLTGFESSVAKLTASLPGLNTEAAAVSQQLGDIGSHVVGGIAGGFSTFGPVIQQVLGYVDQLAGKFETWASGPGGASFAGALGADFAQALPVLENLATAAVHLISALNSSGQGSLGFLGQFSALIAHIPVGVIQAGTTAYLAFRAAVTVTAGLTAASTALKGFAASEEAAAVAGGAMATRAAGGLAAIVGRATPYIAALVAADFATQALVKTNNDWSRSNNTVKNAIGQVGAAFSSIAQFKNPFSAVDANAAARGFDNAIQPVIDAYERIRQEDLQLGRGVLYSTAEPYAARNLRAIATNASLLDDALRGTTVNLSGATQSINEYSTNLAGAAASEKKWLTQGKDSGKVINGVAIYTGTWAAAVAATGNNAAAAADLIGAHADALRDDQQAAAKAAQESANLSAAVSQAASKYHLTADQVSQYGAALGISAEQVATGAVNTRQFSAAIGAVSRAFANGNDAMQGWLTDLGKIDLSSNTLTSRVAVLGAGLKALQGVTLDMAGANLQAVSSVQGVATAIGKNNASIGRNGQLLGQLTRTAHGYVVEQPKLTAGSLAIEQAMSQAGSSAITLAQNIYQNTGSARKASDAYYGLRQSLIQNLEQMGYFPAKAKKIADSVYGIPDKKFVSFLQKGDLPSAIRSLSTSLGNFARDFHQILVHLGLVDAASPGLRNVHDIINNIPQTKTVTVYYNQVTTGSAPGQRIATTAATGGLITGPGSGTSDSIPAMLSNGEFVVRASQASKHRALLENINKGAQGFAAGGIVHSGKDWIYNGIRYASERAALNAETRAQQRANKAGPAGVQKLIGQVGQTPSPPFDINQQGFTAIAAQISKAQRALLSWHGPLEKTRKYEQEIIHLSTVLQHQLQRLRIKIDGADLKAVKSAIGGTADQVRASFQTLITDLRHEGASAGQIARVRHQETAVVAANNRYTAARDYSSGIKSTLAGTFDPTQYGSVQDLIGGLQGQTGQNNAYAGELKKLRGESKGNKRLTAFINQLAASGQTTTLESLASASKSDLANVSKSLGAYTSSLQTGANAATTTKYGKTADQLHSDVDRMVQHTDKVVANMVHAVTALAHAVGNQHRHGHAHTQYEINQALSEMATLVRHGRN